MRQLNNICPMFKHIFIILVISIFFTPQTAYAYLDPGSGSALFTSIIAIATAGFYSVKMLYYKLVGKDVAATTAGQDSLVIFSEGKSYWGSFEPIVQKLIEKKIHFRYVSLDVFDPALTIENEYMHSKLYAKSSAGFGKIAAVKAPLMLATTPNIGSEGYPFPRPKNVKELVHIFHSMTDSSNYRLGSLDFYDSIIMMGEHQAKFLRHVEEVRHIKEKEMVALGLPYLDNLYDKLKSAGLPPVATKDKKTILIAPSWGSKGCLNYFGTEFVSDLHARGYNIIARLHPHSLLNEPEKVAQWKADLSSLENFAWDEELYSTKAMHEADILISDTSSVRFDFAFLHLKPVITLSIPQDNRPEFESSYHEQTWDVKVAPSLGAVVEKSEISTLSQKISDVLATFDTNTLATIRDENIKNFGDSAENIVTFLQEKISKEESAT